MDVKPTRLLVWAVDWEMRTQKFHLPRHSRCNLLFFFVLNMFLQRKISLIRFSSVLPWVLSSKLPLLGNWLLPGVILGQFWSDLKTKLLCLSLLYVAYFKKRICWIQYIFKYYLVKSKTSTLFSSCYFRAFPFWDWKDFPV